MKEIINTKLLAIEEKINSSEWFKKSPARIIYKTWESDNFSLPELSGEYARLQMGNQVLLKQLLLYVIKPLMKEAVGDWSYRSESTCFICLKMPALMLLTRHSFFLTFQTYSLNTL